MLPLKPELLSFPIVCITLLNSGTQGFLNNWSFEEKEGSRLTSLTPWLF